MIEDGLWDAFNDYHMGITAENLAEKYGLTREEQDAFAAASQQKAIAAIEGGASATRSRRSRSRSARRAAELRYRRAAARRHHRRGPGQAQAGLQEGRQRHRRQRLQPQRRAAAVLLMSAAKAKALGLPVLARIASYASAGVDPAIMGIGPVSATRRALDKAGWSLEQLDLIEANEAFAAQSLAVGRELGWDAARVNVNGGAIALGHPIGASGCRVLVTLLHEMIRRDAKKGLATLCIGGGQGVALTLARD